MSLLSKKCVYRQFLAYKFIPTITKVHASVEGTSLRHGAKVIGGHLLLFPGHSLSLPGDFASLPGNLPSLPGHFPGLVRLSDHFWDFCQLQLFSPWQLLGWTHQPKTACSHIFYLINRFFWLNIIYLLAKTEPESQVSSSLKQKCGFYSQIGPTRFLLPHPLFRKVWSRRPGNLCWLDKLQLDGL